jgi:hypothetical protein
MERLSTPKAETLTLELTVRWFCHLNTGGPSQGCFRIQASQWGELLLKQYKANSTKGVVGKRGKKTPRIPIPRKINPKHFKTNCFKPVLHYRERWASLICKNALHKGSKDSSITKCKNPDARHLRATTLLFDCRSAPAIIFLTWT